jgi:quinoprotein glucose dehydrogenase
MRRLFAVGAALMPFVTVLVAQAPAGRGPSAASRSTSDWPAYGGGPEQTRYSALSQINRENVAQLQVALAIRPARRGDRRSLPVNPIVIDGTLYTITPGGRVIALHGATES